jgi:hypothetical protein
MNDFITRLAARTLMQGEYIRPRPVSRFEPDAPALQYIAEAELETADGPQYSQTRHESMPALSAHPKPDSSRITVSQIAGEQRQSTPIEHITMQGSDRAQVDIRDPSRPAATEPMPSIAESAVADGIQEAQPQTGAVPAVRTPAARLAPAVRTSTQTPEPQHERPRKARVEMLRDRASGRDLQSAAPGSRGILAEATVSPAVQPPQTRPSTSDDTETIHVTIGRVEVRAVIAAPSGPPSRPPASPRRNPAMPLDDYLKRRDGERR